MTRTRDISVDLADRLLRRIENPTSLFYTNKRDALAEELEKILTNNTDNHHDIFKDCVGFHLDE